MHLVVIGLSHKTAPVEIREKLTITEALLPNALENLKSQDRISECVILSTCNRTEIYACTPTNVDDEVLIEWMREFLGISPNEFQPHLYSMSGHKAIEHIFRVAAGIDSMVVGEAQILGQVKNAYAAAVKACSTRVVLSSIFQQAITVGKRARTETEIGRGAFSVGFVAVQFAKSIFDELKGRVVLIIGAGKMGELIANHLLASGVSNVLVANRTHEKGIKLAERFNGRAVKYENLPSAMQSADIVITSTGAASPIINRQMAASVMHERRGRPLFIIDIAMPRDVESGVSAIDGMFVYDIDDLQAAVGVGATGRKFEIAKVEVIITEEVADLMARLRTLDVVPVITALREKFEAIRLQELEKLNGRLSHLSPEELELINITTSSIVNKICHTPMIQIKDYAARDDASARLDAICDLFGICPDADEEKKPNMG